MKNISERALQTKTPEHERGVINEVPSCGAGTGRGLPGLQGQVGRSCSWPGEDVGRFWQRILATKLGFLSFLTTLLKNDLMVLEKVQGRTE